LPFALAFPTLIRLPDIWQGFMPGLIDLVYNIAMLFAYSFLVIAMLHQTNCVYTDSDDRGAVSSDVSKRLFLKGVVLLLMVSVSIFIGMFLFIVPGVFLYVTLFFAFALFTLDEQSFLDAYKNSFTLVLGNWWRTFAIILLACIVPMALLSTISFQDPLYGLNNLSRGILTMVIWFLFLPWFYGVTVVLFHDLKLRKKI